MSSEESVLLGSGLETTVTQLGRSIDELEVNVLQVLSLGVDQHRFSEEKESLLGPDAASLDQDEVISDDTVVGESSQRGNVLLSDIGVSGSVIFSSSSFALSDSVDLLVELSSVEIS